MIKMDKSMLRLFMSEAKAQTQSIEEGLGMLKKNQKDKKAVEKILAATHSLEGNSQLADDYKIAYFAAKISQSAKEKNLFALAHFLEELKQRTKA